MPHDPAASLSTQRLQLAHALVHTRRAQATAETQRLPQPAWDILLELYYARDTGGAIDADRLAALTGSTRPTLQRWLKVLQGEGMVEPAPELQLTPRAVAAIGKLLDAGLDSRAVS